jgi:glycosyltransferase involved in cell wall biosynthesis
MHDVISIYAPGHYDLADSYGLIACQLARHLTALGARINAFALGEAVHASQPDDLRVITGQPIRAALGGIVLAYPTAYEKYGPLSMAGPRVAITMFESTRLPEGWADSLNACQAVIVPSRFCRDVFVEAGVEAPVHVIPLGIDETYRPARRSSDSMPYTFLAFADRGRRKGWHEALQAFVQAFGDDSRVRLILKMRARDQRINVLNSNIDMVQQDMSPAALGEFYRQADCMVFPAHGEGFGLPPREFAATGGTVIATNWGGLADDIRAWGIPLGCSLESAWKGHPKFEHAGLGDWAAPDVDQLATWMQVVADQRTFFAQVSYERAGHVRAMYDWRAFAEGVLEVWKGVTRAKHHDTAHAAA